MEKKSIMHYNCSHKILLVGEGDFSFALCLARAFGSAFNIVATSLDSRVSLKMKYTKASSNLSELEDLGCTILHEVDVHKITQHNYLKHHHDFDRIIFNFPHSGHFQNECDEWVIEEHKKLVSGFLRSAKDMVCAMGEIHITHKIAYPFTKWNIKNLAENMNISFIEEVEFQLHFYPGYRSKKGAGSKCNKTFPIGKCSTFKFVS